MGKLMHNTQIKHSSHPHFLQLLSPSLNIGSSTCAGCNISISSSSGDIYGCTPCNFFLHTSCSKFPELITHPSHPEHALSLLPTPIYPGGFFRCDACTQQGSCCFSYHCHVCDFDLHVMCASKPLSVNRPGFHPHPLILTFASPYGQKSGFSCDVCPTFGSPDQWLYRCVSCEFDVHLHCATAPYPPVMQHSQFSSPHSAAHAAHNRPVPAQTYLQPQAQPPVVGLQTYLQPQPQPPVVGLQTYLQSQPQPPVVGLQTYTQPQPQQQQQQPVGGLQTYQPPNQNGNGLANVMVTGFVDGMMQQLGQNFVQSLTGGDDGGGGGGGGGADVVNVEFQCNEEDYNN